MQGNERAAKALAEMESKMKELSEEDAKLAHQEFLKQVIIRKWSFLGEKSIIRFFCPGMLSLFLVPTAVFFFSYYRL